MKENQYLLEECRDTPPISANSNTAQCEDVLEESFWRTGYVEEDFFGGGTAECRVIDKKRKY